MDLWVVAAATGAGYVAKYWQNFSREKDTAGPFRSQGNEMLLFFLGITVGIFYTVMANNREVDNLNELLEHTENLAQALQKKLEMRDAPTMKELANEDYQSREINNLSSFSQERVASSSKPEWDESRKDDSRISSGQKVENSELMTEIEAELEAELERLELGTKGSTLEGVSDFVELEPVIEVDVVRGDLKLDVVHRQLDRSSTNSDHDESNPTPRANYAVSPRELSLRLHKVIESELKARIMELEIALHNSQSWSWSG